jgi:hypothetical protein
MSPIDRTFCHWPVGSVPVMMERWTFTFPLHRQASGRPGSSGSLAGSTTHSARSTGRTSAPACSCSPTAWLSPTVRRTRTPNSCSAHGLPCCMNRRPAAGRPGAGSGRPARASRPNPVARPAGTASGRRPRPAPVPWPEMIRAVLAICVPLSASLALGKGTLGVLPAMGRSGRCGRSGTRPWGSWPGSPGR